MDPAPTQLYTRALVGTTVLVDENDNAFTDALLLAVANYGDATYLYYSTRESE